MLSNKAEKRTLAKFILGSSGQLCTASKGERRERGVKKRTGHEGN